MVLLALLLAQWTALAHAIAHGPQLAGARQAVTASASDRDAVWGHASNSAPCRLLDHLLIGQATGSDPVALPPIPPAITPPACLPPVAVPRLAARVYEARGPPRA